MGGGSASDTFIFHPSHSDDGHREEFADTNSILSDALVDGSGNAIVAASEHDMVAVPSVTASILPQHPSDFHLV
jgi:hypothetical protein